MRKLRNQKGFTIMELMIVIVIIGILMMIAVPAYQNFRAKAQAQTCKANQRTIASACGLYQAENGAWPAAIGNVVGAGLYLETLPVCPTGGVYSLTATGATCTLHP